MNNDQQALYYANSLPITQKDIESSLIKSGLKKGDTIMVHSDVGAFGKMGDVTNKDEFLNSLLTAFLNVLGEEGTLIVPTYTYSFCKNEVFDILKSKSTVGLFSEFVRTQKESIRSYDPIFSHAGIGKKANELLDNVSNDCFGKDSFFDRFYKVNGKIINFGKFFDITFLHYIERKFEVDYRFDKMFSGKIISEDGLEEEKEVTFYVRFLPESGIDVEYQMPKLEEELNKKGLLEKVNIGDSFIICSKSQDCYSVGMDMLNSNEYVFLRNNPHELKIDNLPFFIGVLDSPDNKGLPMTLPFILRYDKVSGLITQKYLAETDNFLEKAYKMGSLVSTNLGQGTFGERRANDVLKHLLSICDGHLEETSFLEIGCADGYLLHKLKLLGVKSVVGCEPGPVAIEGEKKFGIKIINDFYKPGLIKDKFDVIFSYGVLEHINDPLAFINLKKECLKTNGKIFIAVPNCEQKLKMVDTSVLGHEHWNYFTKNSLGNIFKKAGFKNIHLTTGINQAMIYAWGEKSNDSYTVLKDSEKNIFINFCSKIYRITPILQKKLNELENNNKSIGFYAGGFNTISLLDYKTEPRFFDGDVVQQKKFYPGFKNPIENPFNLLKNKVDELWIMAIDYDQEIREYLSNDLKIGKDITVVSIKELLEQVY